VTTVLVTGASGSIGKWVCRDLLRRGLRCIAADVREAANTLDGVICCTADVTDAHQLENILKIHAVDMIVHLAAALPPACASDMRGAMNINIDGTLAVLEAAKNTGIQRVVYASSFAQYAAFSGRFDIRTMTRLTKTIRAAPCPDTGSMVPQKFWRRNVDRKAGGIMVRNSSPCAFPIFLVPGAARGDFHPTSPCLIKSLQG